MTWATLMLATLLSPERLSAEGMSLRHARQLEAAQATFELCVEHHPSNTPCLRGLGSVLAARATRTRDPALIKRAQRVYGQFLELNPPDDSRVLRDWPDFKP
jgi:hypothetical protein